MQFGKQNTYFLQLLKKHLQLKAKISSIRARVIVCTISPRTEIRKRLRQAVSHNCGSSQIFATVKKSSRKLHLKRTK